MDKELIRLKKKTNRKKEYKLIKNAIEKNGKITQRKRMTSAIVISFLVMIMLTSRIAWIQFVDGKSTTNTIKRIQNSETSN